MELTAVRMKTPYEHSNPVIRYSLFAAGWVFFVLAIIGAILPVMPTSVFLILSAACFLRSSPRFYRWLTEHRLFGQPLREYLNGHGISTRSKVLILASLWVAILISVFVFLGKHWGSGVMLSIAALVSVYILWQPTPPRSDERP